MKTKFIVLFLLAISGWTFANDCLSAPVTIPPPTEEATRFYQSGNLLWGVDILWTLAICVLLLFSGFSGRLRDFCQRKASKWLWQVAMFVLLFILITTVLSLPLNFYVSFLRPHSYHLSHQSLGRWMGHFGMQTGISAILGVILAWIFYGILRKSPKRWWLYFGLLTFPMSMFFLIIQPIFIAPLFNKFHPMENAQLKEKILTLAERGGIEGSRIYVVDKSQDTSLMNAYVTGIGETKRIVLWDTIIKGLDEEELLFVMGHEMGHYVLHHLWWSLFISTLIAIFTALLVFLLAPLFINRWGPRFGFTKVSNIASLPLILLLYNFLTVFISPVWNLCSQSYEHAADVFGLELTHSNHAAATGFVKLQCSSLGYPWPGKFYMLYRTGHPSIGERITFFNHYKPWCEGKPSVYQKYFQSFTEKPTPTEIPEESQ